MKSLRFFSAVTIALSFLIASSINADTKYFARSYTAYTLPAKALELEFWQTGRIEKGIGYYYRWQPRIELEYGVTDCLTASVYFNFNEVKSSGNTYTPKALGVSTTSFEFRYRLSNPNEWAVDPALYFEFGYGGDKIFYEPKLLLSKRFDKITTVFNLVSEIERAPMIAKTESKFEVSAGAAYEVSKNIALGLEFRNHRNYTKLYEKELNQASFVGPTVSLFTDKLFIVFNFLAQVSGSPATKSGMDLVGHEKYEIRTILGVEL